MPWRPAQQPSAEALCQVRPPGLDQHVLPILSGCLRSQCKKILAAIDHHAREVVSPIWFDHVSAAIPRAGRPQDWNLNDRIRREGTRNLLAACQKNGVARYVQQSITLLYGDCGNKIVDETQALHPIPLVESACDMEAMVQESPTDWCILRGGLLYGPGTWREEAWRQEAREGRLRWFGQGEAFMSLIHVTDLANAMVQAVESAPSHSIYNVVDDRPVTCRDLYRHIAASVGALEPSSGGEPNLVSLGCSNRKLRAELHWEPGYPTFQSGLVM